MDAKLTEVKAKLEIADGYLAGAAVSSNLDIEGEESTDAG